MKISQKKIIIVTLLVLVAMIIAVIRINTYLTNQIEALQQAQTNYATAQQNIAQQVGLNTGNIATIVTVLNPDAAQNLEKEKAEEAAIQKDIEKTQDQ